MNLFRHLLEEKIEISEEAVSFLCISCCHLSKFFLNRTFFALVFTFLENRKPDQSSSWRSMTKLDFLGKILLGGKSKKIIFNIHIDIVYLKRGDASGKGVGLLFKEGDWELIEMGTP